LGTASARNKAVLQRHELDNGPIEFNEIDVHPSDHIDGLPISSMGPLFKRSSDQSIGDISHNSGNKREISIGSSNKRRRVFTKEIEPGYDEDQTQIRSIIAWDLKFDYINDRCGVPSQGKDGFIRVYGRGILNQPNVVVKFHHKENQSLIEKRALKGLNLLSRLGIAHHCANFYNDITDTSRVIQSYEGTPLKSFQSSGQFYDIDIISIFLQVQWQQIVAGDLLNIINTDMHSGNVVVNRAPEGFMYEFIFGICSNNPKSYCITTIRSHYKATLIDWARCKIPHPGFKSVVPELNIIVVPSSSSSMSSSRRTNPQSGTYMNCLTPLLQSIAELLRTSILSNLFSIACTNHSLASWLHSIYAIESYKSNSVNEHSKIMCFGFPSRESLLQKNYFLDSSIKLYNPFESIAIVKDEPVNQRHLLNVSSAINLNIIKFFSYTKAHLNDKEPIDLQPPHLHPPQPEQPPPQLHPPQPQPEPPLPLLPPLPPPLPLLPPPLPQQQQPLLPPPLPQPPEQQQQPPHEVPPHLSGEHEEEDQVKKHTKKGWESDAQRMKMTRWSKMTDEQINRNPPEKQQYLRQCRETGRQMVAYVKSLHKANIPHLKKPDTQPFPVFMGINSDVHFNLEYNALVCVSNPNYKITIPITARIIFDNVILAISRPPRIGEDVGHLIPLTNTKESITSVVMHGSTLQAVPHSLHGEYQYPVLGEPDDEDYVFPFTSEQRALDLAEENDEMIRKLIKDMNIKPE